MGTMILPREAVKNEGRVDQLDLNYVMLDSIRATSSEQFSRRFTAEEIRHAHLVRCRNWFAIFAAVLAISAGACVYIGLPYQPFVAALIATLGSVVVLAMKATGK